MAPPHRTNVNINETKPLDLSSEVCIDGWILRAGSYSVLLHIRELGWVGFCCYEDLGVFRARFFLVTLAAATSLCPCQILLLSAKLGDEVESIYKLHSAW